MSPRRAGIAVTLLLHAGAAAALLSYAPARNALSAAAPLMVELITPPKVEPPPHPPTELPKPKPVTRHVERALQPPPRLTAPAEAPSPIVAPAPPPAPLAPIAIAAPPAPPAPAPVAISPPIFDADYLDNPAPSYPRLSRRNGHQGRVVLRVLVNARGTADEVQVRTGSGHGQLDEAARDTVRRWRFVPAKRGDEPVAAWVLVPISFRLEG